MRGFPLDELDEARQQVRRRDEELLIGGLGSPG